MLRSKKYIFFVPFFSQQGQCFCTFCQANTHIKLCRSAAHRLLSFDKRLKPYKVNTVIDIVWHNIAKHLNCVFSI